MKDDFALFCKNLPVRNSKQQKREFAAFAQKYAEAKGLAFSRQNGNSAENLIMGDVNTAKLILCAHYDTAFESKNALTCVLDGGFFSYLNTSLKNLLFHRPTAIANKFNVNDNSSGVFALLRLADLLKDKNIAYVFFDLEEDGLKGSRLFYNKNRTVLEKIPVINLDCVGVGTEIGVLYYRSHMSAFAKEVSARLVGEKVQGSFYRRVGYGFSTDAALFLNALSISVFSKREDGAKYFGNIHCRYDTYANLEIIYFLTDKLADFCREFVEKE